VLARAVGQGRHGRLRVALGRCRTHAAYSVMEFFHAIRGCQSKRCGDVGRFLLLVTLNHTGAGVCEERKGRPAMPGVGMKRARRGGWL